MARASQRRGYLESSLPGDWNEYLTGKKSPLFVTTDSGLGTAFQQQSPTLIGSIFDQKSTFESRTPEPDSLFERFLNLQRNPESLISTQMRLPSGFNQAMNMASSFEA